MSKKFRILSIDGGGVRGILATSILMGLEEKSGKRIWDMFDLIVGTSTGALIALALTVPKNGGTSVPTAEELRYIYTQKSPLIFNKSIAHSLKTGGGLWGPKYDSIGLEVVAQDIFGNSSLKNALTNVCIPAFCLQDSVPFLFQSILAYCDVTEVAVAAASAPTYFSPKMVRQTGPYIDAGIYVNNPESLAANYALSSKLIESKLYRVMTPNSDINAITLKKEPTKDDLYIVSIGTGVSKIDPKIVENQDFGIYGWVVKAGLIGMMINADSSWYSEETKSMYPNTVRMQTEIPNNCMAIDDASPENLARLVQLGTKFRDDNSKTIDEVVKVLIE